MKKIKLKDAMVGLQAQMDAKLTLSRKTLTHPVAIGDVSELEWIELLAEYLPRRYSVDKGFVVDHEGSVSDQVDILVYDRQYTPFVLHLNGVKYIPAEAIYAAIECKQDINLANLKYAAKKAKSVRSLKRTSLPIMSAGGELKAKRLHSILCGLVCVGGSLGPRGIAYLEKCAATECLNYVCALTGVYSRNLEFDPWEKSKPPRKFKTTDTNLSLVSFVMNLIGDLQAIGTVPAIDVRRYLAGL